MSVVCKRTWVESFLNRDLTDFQRQAVELLCQAKRSGPYNFTSTWKSADWNFGGGVRFVLYQPQFATYDGDGLTTLVLGAHDLAIRVEIEPVNFSHIAVIMHQRRREHESMCRRHPSLEQALGQRPRRLW